MAVLAATVLPYRISVAATDPRNSCAKGKGHPFEKRIATSAFCPPCTKQNLSKRENVMERSPCFRVAMSSLAMAAAMLAVGCSSSKQSGTSSAAGPVGAPSNTHPTEHAPPKGCDLVTEAEMSVILGGAVVAKSDDSNGKIQCIYTAATGLSPYVELSIEWGNGEAAMTAMGMLARHEPGIADPYNGIGDQAAAVGPALMIRTGQDLMTIMFSGVDDAPLKARRIFDTAKARL